MRDAPLAMPAAPPQAGHFWKVPYIREAGGTPAAVPAGYRFETAPGAWLRAALARVMASSVDESDQAAVEALGATGAAAELLEVDTGFFEPGAGGWQQARLADGEPVGFVLPVLLKPAAYWREGRPTGSLYYVGVLPEHRGRGHGAALLAHATAVFDGWGCWRVFCDTSARNTPMRAAFLRAGYAEKPAWERPLR